MLFHKIQGAGGVGGVVLEPSYKGTTGNVSTSTLTVTDADLGTPSSSRVIAVIIAGRSRNPTSVTIGGVSATQLAATAATGSNRRLVIWYAEVPAGATGDIVASFATSDTSILFWYVLYPTSSTPVDSGKVEGNTNTLTLANLAKTEGGFVIGGITCNTTTSASVSGTGPETVIEDYQTPSFTRASYSFVVTATSTTDDYTASFGSSSNSALSMASWA